MKRVITHAKPDADAIAAAWLAVRYLFPGEEIEVSFVARPRPGQPVLIADCLVDIGCAFDSSRLIFDHKPPAFADRNATCATKLVWEHLLRLGEPVAHLGDLVRVIHEGDLSPPRQPTTELSTSRSEGFHFHLKQRRAQGGDDLHLFEEMRSWLDHYDREERARQKRDEAARTDGIGTRFVEAEDLGVCDLVSDPQVEAAMSPGKPEGKGEVRQPFSSIAALLPGLPSSPVGDGLPLLESLLRELGHAARRSEPSAFRKGANPEDRVTAMRETISELLVPTEPDSKLVRVLRGLRLLVDVEAIAPGLLADRRREAGGWMYRLSVAHGTPGGMARDLGMREFRVSRPMMEQNLGLAKAVQVITGNCGSEALRLLLMPGSRLRDKLIPTIGAMGPERQAYALSEAAQGRDPMARPAEGVWPMDTRDFGEVTSRLGRALGLVEWNIADIPRLPASLQPTPEKQGELLRHLEGIECLSPQLLRLVAERGTKLHRRDGSTTNRNRTSAVVPKPLRIKSMAQLVGRLDASHYYIEKCVRNLPRLAQDVRPNPDQETKIRTKLSLLVDRSRELRRLSAGLGLLRQA